MKSEDFGQIVGVIFIFSALFGMGFWAGDTETRKEIKQLLVENKIAVYTVNSTNGITSFQVDTNKLPIVPKWLK